MDAVWADVLGVVRLLSICFGRFGLGGCVCQMALTLQPMWRKVSTSKAVRCTDGDPFELLMNRIFDMIQQGAEDLVNDIVIDPVNYFVDNLPFPLDNIGRPLNRVCWPTTWVPDRCEGGPITHEEAARLSQCEETRFGLENMCYFARVHQICSNEDMLIEYNDLFHSGYQTVDEVEAEFNKAFGESFQVLDPTLAELMRQVEISSHSGPDLQSRKDICSGAAFASAMTLDMVCSHLDKLLTLSHTTIPTRVWATGLHSKRPDFCNVGR